MSKLSEIGERSVIQEFVRYFPARKDDPLPIGDDAAAVRVAKNLAVVMKTDMLVASTDIPSGMTLRQAARKAVVMNVSDFAAKGVPPKLMVVSVGLPSRYTDSEVKEIASGLKDAATAYGLRIVGGDTNESSELIISCALCGFVHPSLLVSRGGAKPGDIVATTGDFGTTAAGLHLILEGGHARDNLIKALTSAVHEPESRLTEGLALARSGAVSASIDSSDGLAWSLHELAAASKVGIELIQIPLSAEAEEFASHNNLKAEELVLYGGEEFELVFTVKPGKLRLAKRAVGKRFRQIGVVTGEVGHVTLLRNGGKERIEARGWEHFRTKRSVVT